MNLIQAALLAGAATVLALWCARQAFRFGPAPIYATYRRLYEHRSSGIETPGRSKVDRWLGPLGSRLAQTELAARIEAPRRHAFLVAGVSLPLLATRVVLAAFIGFVTGLSCVVVVSVVGSRLPWLAFALVPAAMAGLMGWYQLSSVVSIAGRRYRAFREGVAAYVQLVAVCMTTRRSTNEAITYAAEIGTGQAFETINAAVRAAPQMGIRVWEALEMLGQQYDCRELEDLASSVAHVARIGVGVESTVSGVATRMRQVALDDMQRLADRQTASMVGPTIAFVAGVVLFLGYPLVIRIFDSFTVT